ncbi:MAG TPA: hypothetical protein VF627_08395 [Abditibacterium sp.]|jgi:hypothetical protein
MSQNNPVEMKQPIQFFFREYLEGDLKKFNLKSNTARSGGGARDLRIPVRFAALLAPFFTQPTFNGRSARGNIHWVNDKKQVVSTLRALWQPTKSRPQEARIDLIRRIDGWRVNEEEFLAARNKGEIWFFLLILDSDQKVWAQVYKDEDWRHPKTDSNVRGFFEQQVAARTGKDAVCGFMDFQTGANFP